LRLRYQSATKSKTGEAVRLTRFVYTLTDHPLSRTVVTVFGSDDFLFLFLRQKRRKM
jgi:hypothetical protein